ncbi:DNA methyltransferase [Celeribacter sp.]|uniref:DNA methyltransferase n=1 Tax=Celeribacter sp. TaxID=1890673 RepID=UPI003A8D0F4C
MSFGAGGTPLPAQAANWPTPASRDFKGENSADHIQNAPGKAHMSQLPNFVAHSFTHPDHQISSNGQRSYLSARNMRPLLRLIRSSATRAGYAAILRGHATPRLNPIFVEWLMGWPPGHALCDCSAMEFIRWQRDMRGALSRLPSTSAAWIWEPAPEQPSQMELF